MKLISLLSVLLLAGCATSSTITRHEVTLEEIQATCWRHKEYGVGCATWANGSCNVYVPKKSEYTKLRALNPKIAKVDDLTIELYLLGHEAKHCFDGQWH